MSHAPHRLSEVDALASMSEGFAQLAGSPGDLVAIEAEVELWEQCAELEPGGMRSAVGGDSGELVRRLRAMLYRPELTSRQRAVTCILLNRAKRLAEEERAQSSK